MKQKKRDKSRLMPIPELLAPAGNFEKLVTAIHYGATAVYLGGPQYGLRAKAGNFSHESIGEAVIYAHRHQVRVYVTVNIFAHLDDFEGLESYLLFLDSAGVDGIIISDPGIFMLARKLLPHQSIHLSTQANVTNPGSASFWAAQGASRINLARELSLPEIKAIRASNELELELFVHGAVCISYSGRCMLSNYMTGRDANRGACAHPCRYSYVLMEEKRPEEYFPVEEDNRGTYIFNSKDLCLLRRLPEIVASGVDSLKIEGRMKSIFYVGGVVRVYRAALDYLAGLDEADWKQPEMIVIPEEMMREIEKTGTRDITENFIDEPPGPQDMLYHASRFEQDYEPVAVIREGGDEPLIEARNVLRVGERIEFMEQSCATCDYTITRMEDLKGAAVTRANPGNRVRLQLIGDHQRLKVHGIFRRRKLSQDPGAAPRK